MGADFAAQIVSAFYDFIPLFTPAAAIPLAIAAFGAMIMLLLASVKK